MNWPPVTLDTPMRDLAGKHLAVSGTSIVGKPTLVLISVRKRLRNGKVRFLAMDTALRTAPPPVPVSAQVPGSASLAEVMLAFGPIQADAAGEVPDIAWASNTRVDQRRMTSYLLYATAAVFLVLAVVLQRMDLILAFVPSAIVIAGLAWLGPPRSGSYYSLTPPTVKEGSRDVLSSAVTARLTRDSGTVISASDRVDQVKAQYAQLRDDIIYRIENSALFDSAVPQTQRFEIALLQWSPNSIHAEDLADELEQAFRVAREHAENLGLNHLPQTAQPAARKAVKAAAVALGNATEAERSIARKQVAELLSGLALYWLPVVDQTTPSLIGKRKMIQPAP